MAPSILAKREWKAVSCHFDPNFSAIAILTTIVIIVLTITIEIVANAPFPESKKEEPTTPLPESATQNEADAEPEAPKPPPPAPQIVLPEANKPPRVRALRTIWATMLIIPICIAFGLRIDNAVNTIYYGKCNNMTINPSWTLIAIFNIVPFACACTAWLRTVVDCILVRWNKSIAYWVWPPLFPLYWVIFPLIFLWAMLEFGAYGLMGKKSPRGKNKVEEVEMQDQEQDEESRALVDNVDGLREDDDETVYEAQSPKESKFDDDMV
ncbi:hypothetical protein BDV96DRAFT_607235 [Lophiotrema nucula]|uniref:Uncharacterized protein n=1 Tax=Lophiotrema nucula TaxID=690887 RepID=A0A6A5YH18_9PLEO|nr:hypothetical protein BDV96DRAFT_607235 [Lophiotrema nucula]